MTVTLFMVVSRDGVYALDGDTDISAYSSKEDREFFLSSLRGSASAADHADCGHSAAESANGGIKGFDACIMGARSCSHDVPVKRKYVLSHHDIRNTDDRTTVLSGSPKDIYDRVRADGNKKTALIGGAVTDIAFLEAGLVDEMFITVEPVDIPDGMIFDYSPFIADFTLTKIIPLNETGTKVMRYERGTAPARG